jgi:hypothetical protein
MRNQLVDIFGYRESTAVTAELGELWAVKLNIMKAQFKHCQGNIKKNWD